MYNRNNIKYSELNSTEREVGKERGERESEGSEIKRVCVHLEDIVSFVVF